MKIKNIMLLASIFVMAELICAERPGKSYQKNSKPTRDLFDDAGSEDETDIQARIASYEVKLIDVMRDYKNALQNLDSESKYLKNEVLDKKDKERLQKLNANIKDALESVEKKFKHAVGKR
jgi:gas vesicle protein